MLFVKCGVFADAHDLSERTLRDLKSGKEVSLSEVDAKKYIAMHIAVEVEETETIDAPVDLDTNNNYTESPGSENLGD